MDPDVALASIRRLAKDDDGDLAELVRGLDEWLVRGGFLPADWQERRP